MVQEYTWRSCGLQIYTNINSHFEDYVGLFEAATPHTLKLECQDKNIIQV